MELLSQCRELVPNAKSEIWHRSTYLLRLPVFLVLELPLQCMELVPKAKNQIWNHFWLHVVDALSHSKMKAYIYSWNTVLGDLSFKNLVSFGSEEV
jgi:hypothetical protein